MEDQEWELTEKVEEDLEEELEHEEYGPIRFDNQKNEEDQ